MSNFNKFAAAVHAQFVLMSKYELFTTNPDKDGVYAHYLASFPKGTNEIYRERTEHDCSTCRNFIKNIGNVVAIIDGKVVSVWDIKPTGEAAYDAVTQAMADMVKSFPIVDLFRTKEMNYGQESNKELTDGHVYTWHHFHGTIDKRHHHATPDAIMGKFRTDLGVFERGLKELTQTALQQVLDLIDANTLYRGEESRPAVAGFLKAKKEYDKLATNGERNIYVWSRASGPGTSFRNTAIGTLVVDLSAGVDLEAAVRSYEKKVAPENYKRPTALITPAMINDAMKTITDLGIEPALERRYAKISDITVNNVLWVDSSVKSSMKGGVADLLMAAAKPTADIAKKNIIDINIEDFLANILPKAKSIDLLVKNGQQGNFMSLTAPVHPSNGDLFKWENNFAWSYNGNIADSALRKQVQSLGGRVDGVLRFSHTWNYDRRNASLMDLHVFMPGSSPHRDGVHNIYPIGQRVGWNNRKDSSSGGVQDVDYTDAAPEGYIPVENITFPSMDKLKDGDYTFKIHNWSFRAPTQGGFKAEIEFAGQVFQYERVEAMKHHEWITLAVATKKNGEFTIEHKHPVGAASTDVWGVQTEKFTKVNTMLLSPNHWDHNKAGAKHYLFVLDGCANPEPTRGIYNEFLSPALDKHRKVFEVLGDKTKCPVVPPEDQLSGVGFTAARNDSVVLNVVNDKMTTTYRINF
jgi:hypothetical protein